MGAGAGTVRFGPLLFQAAFRLGTPIPSAAVPPFGRGEPFPGYATKVELRPKVTNVEVRQHSSVLIWRMGSTAWNACMALGSDKFAEPDVVGRALQVLRDYFAPADLDAVYQDVVKFSLVRRTAQCIDEYPPQFDLPRRGAETRMHPGSCFPAASVSVA